MDRGDARTAVSSLSARCAVLAACGPAGKPKPNFVRTGCAIVPPNECRIYLYDAKRLLALGVDPDYTLRHQLAHCMGWPGSHPRCQGLFKNRASHKAAREAQAGYRRR